ncbi:kinesin-like protein KIN-6 isoform X3 [Trifolium pratense]|uniref:kinesin-like protein KIN-6 isoform X3 n=1 Tax=Trifolium pratense TaxID=57577 RepID=UPI001E690B74|nr:kinesin-like protein KIN-6 isoform X3 [Trifolium pratense]
MDTATPKSCPYTVTVRRNPPRRARATPLPQGSNIYGITPFPNDDLLSQQIPQNPSSTSENENLKVFLRIRPFQSPTQAPQARAKTAWPKNPAKKITTSGINSTKKKSYSSCISINDSESVTLLVPSDLQESKRLKSETYGGFTHVFSSDSSQVEVYDRMVKPMVDEFIKGKSGMLAALGPSGSGKTHTVFGTPRDPGMVPLVLRHIFKETESARSFYIAIFEIYTERGKAEKLFDLLPDGGELSMQQSTIRGQKEVLISNAEQAESLIAHAVIKRATAMTNTNSQSSRSQCIISIRDVPKKWKGVVNYKSSDAVLTIIDLAGAEREKRTGNQGTRLVESNFINNTLMVFGLCLRSLLEHQKNPKKQLQKHFQNSMLTRYLRDYLEGKKRMTLLLTAKSGEDDYLDTSHLLRQASPYMQIKYNIVEPSNMVPKKRHHQPSSVIDNAKQLPSLAHLKRMRLVSEHTVQNDEKGVDECITSKKVCKLDASSSVSLKLECDSHSGNDRSHIIMRNFARVLWNVLKEYNSKLKVAESKILSLNESIGYEKKKNIELETQLNEFRAACCCKGGNEKIDTEDCSSVDHDHPHNLDQEKRIDAASASELIIDDSDEELTLGTTNSELDYKESERKLSVSSTESGHHNNALEVDVVSKISSETFNAESSSEPVLDQSNAEHMLCTTCSELDYEKPERKLSVSLSKPGHSNALEVDAADKIPCETFHLESSSQPTLEQSDEEHMLDFTSTILDSDNSEREVSASLSKPEICKAFEVDAVRKVPKETIHFESSSQPTLDQSDEEHMLGSTSTILDSENSEREVSASLSKPEIFEVDAVRKVPKETFSAKSLSKPRIDHSDEEHVLGATCTTLDSEISDREVLVSSSEPVHDNSLEVDAVSKIPSETFHTQSSSEPRLNLSSEEPTIGPSCTQFVSEKSDSLVLCVSSSSSKSGDHNDLEVDAKSKIPSELFGSSLSTKIDILDPSSPKDVSSTKAQTDKGVNNSRKPPRPKRTLMPSSSMLSRNLSTFDLFDETDKLKGNRSTRKLGARDDPKRSNGSISLLNLLQQRKSNIRH